MSRATGIHRSTLHASLSEAVDDEKRRPLKDDELIKVCRFLDVNPMDIADDKGRWNNTNYKRRRPGGSENTSRRLLRQEEPAQRLDDCDAAI